jgi:signal peptidase II
MTRWKRTILVLLTIFLCVISDQITKEIARSHLPKTKTLSFAGDTLRLDYVENRGAILSFECCLPEEWRGPVLTAAVAAFTGSLVLCLLFASVLRPLMVVALSMICGGSLSNLLDRIALGGDVVDFLSLGWGGFRTAIFNVADAAITVGTLLFVFGLVWNLLPTSKQAVSPRAS